MGNLYAKRHLIIRTEHNFHLLKIDDIIFLEGANLKTRVHYINHAIRVIELPLHEMEMRLKEYPFWSSDKNHLINLKYLEKVSDTNDGTVLLKGNYQVPIHPDRKQLLIQELDRIG